MSEASPQTSLRPALPSDAFMMRRWHGERPVGAAAGRRARAEAEIALILQSPSSLCRIIESDARPVGYIYAADAALWDEPLRGLPAGRWDIGLVVDANTSDTLGARRGALELMVAEVFATTLAVACCTFVSIREEAAVRAAEQAGFRWDRIWNDPLLGPCWVLLRERAR